MSCPALIDGRAPSLLPPNADEWTFASDGGPSDGVIVTTGAGVVQRVFADLAAVGSAVQINGFLMGAQDGGERGAYLSRAVMFSRNAFGQGQGLIFGVGPNGYTNLAAVPWTTPTNPPAGWALTVNLIVGTTLVVQFNGAAGQTVRWTCRLSIQVVGGATIRR